MSKDEGPNDSPCAIFIDASYGSSSILRSSSPSLANSMVILTGRIEVIPSVTSYTVMLTSSRGTLFSSVPSTGSREYFGIISRSPIVKLNVSVSLEK